MFNIQASALYINIKKTTLKYSYSELELICMFYKTFFMQLKQFLFHRNKTSYNRLGKAW